MKTRHCWTLLVLAFGLSLFGLAVSTAMAGSLADVGQIKLFGVVKSVSPQKHAFLLSAAGFADENSARWTVFSKTRPKTVSVPEGTCYIYAKGFDEGQVKSDRLRVGMPVIVVASTDGANIGKPITAQSVGLFVNGNGFDLTTYRSLLSGGATPRQAGGLVGFANLIGKQRNEIEATLGQPVKVITAHNDDSYVYKLAGTEAVRVFYASRGKGQPKTDSTYFYVSFGLGVTWQQAVKILNLDPSAMKLVPFKDTAGRSQLVGDPIKDWNVYFTVNDAHWSDGTLINDDRGLMMVSFEQREVNDDSSD